MKRQSNITFGRRAARFLQARWCAGTRRETAPSAPVTIQVEVSSRCNLSCVFCCQSRMTRPGRLMEPPLFAQIVESMAGRVWHLQLSNFGEPLLHPQIHRLVAHAAGSGLFVELTTNGVLLDRRCSEQLIAAGVGKVNVSVDSLRPSSYHQIRGTELQPVLENLRQLRAARDRAGTRRPFIVLAGTDMAPGGGDAATLRRACGRLGADACYITPSLNWAGLCTDPQWIKPTGQRYQVCRFPWEFLHISAEGIVTPCCIDAELGHPLGRVRPGHDNLSQIWNHQPLRRLRRALLDADLTTLQKISRCVDCSRLYHSQTDYTVNRLRVELDQLRHFNSWHRRAR